ncbi:MAG TPA: hypothetical protein VK919_09120 [Solirubrobacterales bacterium]|nr:hypothetical protein [Solirubrobacterales bacterium]
MHARITRYEGGAPEELEETLAAKKRVLPTEPDQTEGMKGAIFLADAESGSVVVISLWESEEAMQASEPDAARVREQVLGPGEDASVEHYSVALLALEQSPPA